MWKVEGLRILRDEGLEGSELFRISRVRAPLHRSTCGVSYSPHPSGFRV